MHVFADSIQVVGENTNNGTNGLYTVINLAKADQHHFFILPSP
jgi:hypothetical protein